MARFAMEILQRTHHMNGMASTASLSDAPPQAAAALPNPIRAVIFDMDGTLLDTEAAHRDAFARTGATMGWPMSDEMLLSMVGIHRDENLRMLADRMGPDFPVDQFYADSDALFVAALEAGIPLRPGAEVILDHLARAGIPMAIATSTMAPYARLSSPAMTSTGPNLTRSLICWPPSGWASIRPIASRWRTAMPASVPVWRQAWRP